MNIVRSHETIPDNWLMEIIKRYRTDKLRKWAESQADYIWAKAQGKAEKGSF